MKIRTKLALYFTLIVASILLLFAFTIYFSSTAYREQQFISRLEEKAKNTAKLLIEVDEVSYALLKIIDKNITTLPEEEIVIFNSQNKKIYHSGEEHNLKISPETLDIARKKNIYYYKNSNKDVLAILYPGKLNSFVVIASAYDKYGLNKINNLTLILIGGLLACVLATMLAGWIFAGRMLNPISRVVKEVDKITALSLNQRVNEGNGKDEIAQLAVTFNHMLDRIEEAFYLQKSFVSNASHELRTPLTSITGQIEVSLMNKRSTAEYEAVLSSVLEDIRSLNKLTNGLLELTQANMDIAGLKLSNVRMDELIWQVKRDVLRHHQNYKINFQILNLPEDDSKLIMSGSEQLLKTAFTNLIENACKFSAGKEVHVSFDADDKAIRIHVKDNGIGISEPDLQQIFQPFYRGNNAKKYSGHGLGLSLAQKIVQIHKGLLTIDSVVNQHTIVSVVFPV